MATIAKLNVKLTAGIGGFASAFGKAGKSVTSFAAEAAGAATKLTGLVGGLAALATGGGLAILVKGQMEAIDSTAKLSDRLNISTERFAGLEHAANLAGVSNELLTGSLEKMLKAIGGITDDGESAADVFKRLGLSAQNLANMPTDQAFSKIADSLTKVTNASDRATLASQMFGRNGQALLPLLLSGADGIKAAQVEAEKLGLTFSRIDAAKVEAANDAMTRAGEVFTGMGRTLAVELSPFIDAMATKFTDAATSGKGMGDKVVSAVELIATGVAKAADGVSLLEASFWGLKAAGLQTWADIEEGRKQFVDSLSTFKIGLGTNSVLKPSLPDPRAWAKAQVLKEDAADAAARFDEAMASFKR